MDPLTVTSGFVALVGLGLAWRMHRRATRAEAEIAQLRDTAGRVGAPPIAVPNQRPWRMVQPAAQSRTRAP